MDALLARFLPARRAALAAEMLRFGVVGTAAFVVDTATVYASRGALGLYGAGALSFLVAVTFAWWLNRVWTFRARRGEIPWPREWARYVGANLLGIALNRGTYALLVTVWALAASQPVLATAAGAIAGMGVNFVMARRVVFR